jgi:hypothetical protein
MLGENIRVFTFGDLRIFTYYDTFNSKIGEIRNIFVLIAELPIFEVGEEGG